MQTTPGITDIPHGIQLAVAIGGLVSFLLEIRAATASLRFGPEHHG